ncbi:sirohydrochlorin chelatase [Streptomyces polygonati]|uniref:Sirohydrochlorin chelatase n=1 Tax=Streptomyces polygonati TaxID=1617087 RepID=A0ABV8HJX9_9ACTN
MIPAPAATTLLAVAHGTRDPEGVASYGTLLDRVRAMRPGLPVRLAFLDIAAPSLDRTLAGLRGEVVVVPLLLSAGYHVHVDIPASLAAAPRLRAAVAAALGPDPLLAEALHDRLTQAGWHRAPGRRGAAGQAVVLAAAGSSDPAANADTARTAELLRERLGVDVVPSYLCASSPTPAEAVARLRAAGRQVAVASYLVAPGFFARAAARAAAGGGSARTAGPARPARGTDGLVTGPVGTHAAVARLVLRRYDQAVARTAGRRAGLQYTSRA